MIFGKQAFFGYLLAPDGEVWWFANVPRRDEPARGEVEAIPAEAWRRRLAELYAKDAGPAVRLVQTSEIASKASSIHSIPHLPRWHTSDRRRLTVVPTTSAIRQVVEALGPLLADLDAAAAELTPDQQQAVARYLERVAHALHSYGQHQQ